MALSTTPTIAICLAAGIAGGIALARPADEAAVPDAGSTGYEIDAVEPGASGSDDGYGYNVGTAGASGEDADSASIRIENFAFSSIGPVTPGAELTVTNFDPSTHTLTSRDESFDTGNLARDVSATIIAPTEPGTYDYICELHPSMVGELVVSP